MPFVELAGHRQELLDVGQPLFVLFVAGALEHRLVARLVQHQAQQFLDRPATGAPVPAIRRSTIRDEIGNQPGRPGGDRLHACCTRAGRVQSEIACRWAKCAQPLDRGLADAAGRRVDHAEQGHFVVRIVDKLQPGQDVLDLLPLEELHAVDHLVRHARLAEGQLERPAEGVGAIEDGEIAGAAAAGGDLAGNLGGDPLGLVLVRAIGGHADRFARLVLGEEGFFLPPQVVRNQLVGHPQDPLRAAIVLLQANDADRGKILLEVEDVVQIGPPPAIDRLIRVAGHGQVRIVDREGPGDHVLGQVRVLILVDQDIAVALVQARPHFGILAEQRGDVQQQIVEIDGVGAGQLGLVGGIDLLDDASQRISRLAADTDRA